MTTTDGPGRLDDSSWPTALGTHNNARCAAVTIGPLRRVRWIASLPTKQVQALSVGADNTVYVNTPDSTIAILDSEIRWTVPSAFFGTTTVLDAGILAVDDVAGIAIRRQRDGVQLALIEAERHGPAAISNGHLVFLALGGDKSIALNRARLDGTSISSVVIAAQDNSALVLARPLARHGEIAVGVANTLAIVDGNNRIRWEYAAPCTADDGVLFQEALIGLDDNRVLGRHNGTGPRATTLIDLARQHEPVVGEGPTLRNPAAFSMGGTAVMPGAERTDADGQTEYSATCFDPTSGKAIWRTPTHSPVVAVAAGQNNTFAYATGPSPDRWRKYKDFEGFEQQLESSIVVITADGSRTEWTLPAPIIGPIAIGNLGEVIVPVMGALICVGG